MIRKAKNNVPPSEHVKFISYTGEYPNLCTGLLTLEIDGVKYRFGRDYRNSQDGEYCSFWRSGGGFGSDYKVLGDEWIIDEELLPKELRKYAAEIDKVFNKNVEHGCCGGCL